MKRKMKRVLTAILAMCIITSALVPTLAVQEPEIRPMYVGLANFGASLTISSTGKASCGAAITNNGTYDVDVTIELKRDGTTIKSWTVATEVGFNSIDKIYYVTSGHDYQVVATATVKSGSSVINSYKAYSSIVSY